MLGVMMGDLETRAQVCFAQLISSFVSTCCVPGSGLVIDYLGHHPTWFQGLSCSELGSQALIHPHAGHSTIQKDSSVLPYL